MQLNPEIVSTALGPLVSILITYYNAGPFIRETVESACNQTYQHVEVIVLDDGCADPCAPYLTGMEDKVSVIRQHNAGSAGARNAAARYANGDILLFLDGDDRLLPTAVETQLEALLSNPAAGFAFGAAQRIDQNGRLIRGIHLCRPREDYFGMLLESNPLECMGAALIKRSEFEAIGGFDQVTKNLAPIDDYDIYLRLAYRSPVVRNPHCVIEYRQHTNNISRDKKMMLSRIYTVLDKLEQSMPLTTSQHRRLQHGRRRWAHSLRSPTSLSWLMAEAYYKFRAMLYVPYTAIFTKL